MGYSEPFHLKDVGKNNILLYLVANRFGVNKSYCLALSFNSSFEIGILTSTISSSFVANLLAWSLSINPPIFDTHFFNNPLITSLVGNPFNKLLIV